MNTTQSLAANPPSQPTPLRSALSKVPEVTALFWIIKVLTTGMGETASDYLAHSLGPLPAVALSGLGLVAALVWQFRTRHYVAPVYWSAVVMVSVFGTLTADAAHVGFGVPYWASTVGFLGALGVIFTLWQRYQGTLSIHSIFTVQRETYYWAAVLCTFALGTAAGDLTAVTLRLGWLAAGLVFAAMIAVPGVLARFGLNPVLAFWWAYVLTRPLGASFADWAALPRSRGGMALGTAPVTVLLGALILLLVASLRLRTNAGNGGLRGGRSGPR